MFNKIVIIGNLTRDVELRYLPSNVALATIGLASNRRFKKQDGTMADETCFVDVKLFGRTAEVASQFLIKGSRVLIEGRLSFETWQDQTGAKRSKHTIIAESMNMLDSKSSRENTDSYAQPSTPNNGYQSYQNANQGYDSKQGVNIPEIDIDEEIPF